ncbi:MAG: GC-type dockerin domain-anchored protein, partial [Planctomycetota bacterium]
RIGPAGAVLVGSIDGIFSVTPGGEPALEIPAGSVISNPEDIAFDSQGRLVIANFSSRVLVRFDPFSQTITELAEFPLGILQFALDGDDNAYVVNPGGGIAVVPPDGSGIDRVIGEGQFTGVAVVGDGAAVLPGLYTFDLETGDLLQLDESGQAVRVLAERFEPRTVPAGTVLPAAAELELTETGRLLFAVTETSELSTLFDPCARADVDGDGLITSTDFFAWVAGFGSGDPAADINADGVADVTDFFLFAATTGTCGG